MKKLFVIVGENLNSPEFQWGTHFERRYINFNVRTNEQNPIMVTGCGQRAYNQVYFESEEQAKKFLKEFEYSRSSRDFIDFKIKKYNGIYSKIENETRNVKTIYGDCVALVNAQRGIR